MALVESLLKLIFLYVFMLFMLPSLNVTHREGLTKQTLNVKSHGRDLHLHLIDAMVLQLQLPMLMYNENKLILIQGFFLLVFMF